MFSDLFFLWIYFSLSIATHFTLTKGSRALTLQKKSKLLKIKIYLLWKFIILYKKIGLHINYIRWPPVNRERIREKISLRPFAIIPGLPFQCFPGRFAILWCLIWLSIFPGGIYNPLVSGLALNAPQSRLQSFGQQLPDPPVAFIALWP